MNARGNWYHHKDTCPVCFKDCDRGAAFTMHMRMHVRNGEATEEMFRNEYTGEWERVFKAIPKSKRT